MKRILVLSFLLFTHCLFSQNNSNSKVKELKMKVQLLESKVETLETKIKLLELQIKEFKKNFTNNLNSNSNKPPTKLKRASNNKVKLYKSRCQAKTKKGTQCKRTSRSNGYCWQHGG